MESVIVIRGVTFGLAFIECLLNEFLVVFVLANTGCIETADCIDPCFQCFLFLGIAVFNAFFQTIIKVRIELIA